MSLPGSMKAGLGLSLLGGVMAFVCMAQNPSFEGDNLAVVVLCLFTAVVFFATAGGFSSTSQWNQSILSGFCFICIAFGIVPLIIGVGPLWFAAIEIVLGALCLLCSISGSTQTYLNNLHKD